MKKALLLLALASTFLSQKTFGQTFSPISTTGYDFDAVAEATTAAATTSGALDGSNYVLYSAAYGALYSATGGLPNNGIIASGTRTYQLQSYTVNNMCFTMSGAIDSVIFTSPAAYAGLSLLCFSTEGNGSMNVTVRFTDNTTQVFSNQSLTDWFGTATAITSGFDRASRSTGAPSNTSGNPKMFNIDLVISCANRSKNVQNIKFQNTGTNPRNCIMAVSGAAAPSFTSSSSPVTCSGGINGSANIIPTGGVAPFSYTWSTSPAQYAATANNIGTGVYSYTATDAASCAITGTVAVSQSLSAQPSLSVSSNFYTVCAGASVIMNVSGAATYTWNTGANTTTLTQTPTASFIYTVNGYTSLNCLRNGTVAITVNQLPVITFNTPAALCLNAPQVPLTASPIGGNYAGTGITFGSFFPNIAGVGTKTLSYTYTDGNNCTSVAINTIIVNSIPALNFTVSSTPLCNNGPTLSLNASPAGGTYSGSGVNGSAFSPSLAGVGNSTVAYTYTDANNCTATVVSTAIINAAPVPAFQSGKRQFCINTPSIVLNANPPGGTYGGPGTNGAAGFSPASAGVGVHNVTYSYTDLNNCTGVAAISMTVSACTGINEIATSEENIYVYPNPNAGAFTVICKKNTELLLVNELGQVIRKHNSTNDSKAEWQVSDLSPGIYFILDASNAAATKQKIVVTK